MNALPYGSFFSFTVVDVNMENHFLEFKSSHSDYIGLIMPSNTNYMSEDYNVNVCSNLNGILSITLYCRYCVLCLFLTKTKTIEHRLQ